MRGTWACCRIVVVPVQLGARFNRFETLRTTIVIANKAILFLEPTFSLISGPWLTSNQVGYELWWRKKWYKLVHCLARALDLRKHCLLIPKLVFNTCTYTYVAVIHHQDLIWAFNVQKERLFEFLSSSLRSYEGKRGKIHANASRLVLVLRLTGWNSGANFLSKKTALRLLLLLIEGFTKLFNTSTFKCFDWYYELWLTY